MRPFEPNRKPHPELLALDRLPWTPWIRTRLIPRSPLARALKIAVLVLGALALIVTFVGPYLHLGVKEGFILYTMFGLSRTVAAVIGACLLLLAIAPFPTHVSRPALTSTLLIAIAALCYLAIGEGLARVVTHNSPFAFPNFRQAHGAHDDISGAVQYDPLLGWTIREGIRSNGFNTIAYGIRRNAADQDAIRPGGVLAVGSSFTAGSEVVDEDTWPAQLERLTGMPVVNAGEGGYSADQAILRAELLLPIVKPKVLVVDLIRENIGGVDYSRSGWPKPYFTLENGVLLHHNDPVPPLQVAQKGFDVRDVVGHLLVVDRFMTAFFPDFWLSGGNSDFVRVGHDQVAITCALLTRLKGKADAATARVLLTLQYDGSAVTASRPPKYVTDVEDCARNLGIFVADEFLAMQAIYQQDEKEFLANYILRSDGTTDHKSPLGAMRVAKMVARALDEMRAEDTAGH